jgi:ferredoxin-NADP reductase
MNAIDRLLNRFTMYRLVVYALISYCLLAFFWALAGRLSYGLGELGGSLAVLLAVNYAASKVFGYLWRVPTNAESWLITALILFLIVQPAHSVSGYLMLVAAGLVAMSGKFILAIRGRHIFNPAALAAAVLSLTAIQPAIWWVGSSNFWPLTLLFGLAVVRKTRRFSLLFAFVLVSLTAQIYLILSHHYTFGTMLKHDLISSPLIFLATIMLTEPATMPPRRSQQLTFGAAVGLLYATAWHVGSLYIYPEVALLLGNIYAFILMPKAGVRLELARINHISDRVADYVFRPSRPLPFTAGQYMEWTLPGVPFDSRGNRRSFTIASSPNEPEVHLGVKFYDPSSAFKARLGKMQPGDAIYGGQIRGDFTLQGNQNKKLAWIAGGIGITPFRSMAQSMIDQKLQADIVLLYVVSDKSELAYDDIFAAARQHGLQVVPLATRLDAATIADTVPDYKDRLFYISGPSAMVDATQAQLSSLGVHQIKTDHFAGY